MSISSRIWEMNNHLLDDYDVLELAGADLSGVNKNILNLKMSWKERLLYFINNGTDEVWNNWNKVTGEGEEISLNNTLEAKMKIVLKGNTSQETTTGKNLLNGANPSEYSFATSTFSNDIIKVSSTNTSTLPQARWVIDNLQANDIVRYSGIIQNSNGQIVVQFDNNGVWTTLMEMTSIYTDGVTPITKSFTNNLNTTKVRILLYSSNTLPTGASESNYKNVIVTINNSDMTYEQYTGGIASPNPDYPQEVKVVSGDNSIEVCGKNIFNLANYTIQGWDCYIENPMKTEGSYVVSCVNDYPIANKGVALGFTNTIGSLDNGYFCGYVLGASSKSVAHITTQAQANSKYLMIRSSETTNIDRLNSMKIMLEKGNQATTYEAYKSASYPISLGVENLIPFPYTENVSVKTLYGITYKTNADGSILVNGTATNNSTFTLCNQSTTGIRDTLLEKNCYLTGCPSGGSSSTYTLQLYGYGSTGAGVLRDIGEGISLSPFENSTANFNMSIYIANGTTVNNLLFKPAIIKSSTNQYVSNTPIELCKIGTYQDKIFKNTPNTTDYDSNLEDNVWYLKKEIGKVVLDENSNVGVSVSTNYSTCYLSDLLDVATTTSSSVGLSNYFKINYNNVIGNAYFTSSKYLYMIMDTSINNSATFKTWLGTNNVSVYYVLATPTYETITDTTLTGQLEALKKSYEEQTNISQVNNDLPFELDVTALEVMS